MRNHVLKSALLAVTVIAAAMFTGGLSHAGGANNGAGRAVDTVTPDMVCMVNDTIMDRTQIPVEVDGKTYYGCCNGCVAALKNDPSIRFAKDPVTGRQVDKAKAVILSGPRGIALYFESEETAQKYISSIKK